MTTPFLTDETVSKIVGKSVDYVQAQCRAGKWPHVRLGRSYRFTEAQVQEIADAFTITPTAPKGAAWGRRTRRAG